MKTKKNPLLKELMNSYPQGIVIGKRNLEKLINEEKNLINVTTDDNVTSVVDRVDANVRNSKKRTTKE